MPKHEYPKMVYDPETNQYTVVNTAEEIPEGWTEDLADLTLEEGEEVTKCPLERLMALRDGTAKKAPAKKAPAKKAPAKKAPAKKASAKKPAAKKEETSGLIELDLTREDALEILDDEGIKYDEDASDDEIAALVSEALKD